MADAKVNGWRNVAIGALLSVVLTGATAWFTWGLRAVSRSDVEAMIRTQGPYVEDRQLLLDLRGSVQALTSQVQAHGEQLARLEVLLERLDAQRVPAREGAP